LKRHNFIEFKGVNDPLNEKNFARILGRAFLGHSDVPSNQKRQVVSCIISDAVPHKIFEILAKKGTPFEPIENLPGYYLHKGLLFPIYIITCNRLPITPLYHPLLMFASGQHLTEYFEQLALDTGMEVFLKYIVRMYPKEGAKLYEKIGDIMLTAEDQRYIADVLNEVLPPEQKLELFRKNEELVEIVVKDRLEELDSQALVKLLSPEKIAALKKLLSENNEPA
jgi:hypothetical protein